MKEKQRPCRDRDMACFNLHYDLNALEREAGLTDLAYQIRFGSDEKFLALPITTGDVGPYIDAVDLAISRALAQQRLDIRRLYFSIENIELRKRILGAERALSDAGRELARVHLIAAERALMRVKKASPYWAMSAVAATILFGGIGFIKFRLIGTFVGMLVGVLLLPAFLTMGRHFKDFAIRLAHDMVQQEMELVELCRIQPYVFSLHEVATGAADNDLVSQVPTDQT